VRDIAPWVLTIVITIAVAATIILRGPIGRGLGRAMEVGAGAAGNPEHDARIAQLEQRVAELEAVQARLTELEERVDFAERLLTRGEAAGRLPGIRESE
jgi:Tfp pilus assembly protein PilO